jgi:hypothetical protein
MRFKLFNRPKQTTVQVPVELLEYAVNFLENAVDFTRDLYGISLNPEARQKLEELRALVPEEQQ